MCYFRTRLRGFAASFGPAGSHLYVLHDDAEPVPVWQAQQAIRERLGMRQVYYNGLPQRYKWLNTPHPNDGTLAAFRFTFEVRDLPEGPVFLALQHATKCMITLNGERGTIRPHGEHANGQVPFRSTGEGKTPVSAGAPDQ